MTYSVKEIYHTLQGEGHYTGRAAVFFRFAGCNLWSGREADRGSAVCRFCDTDFLGTDGPGGGRYATAEALADRVAAEWPRWREDTPYVVCTGGEPLLQLDGALIRALHERGIEVGIETNGTLPVPDGVDWICVSPKADAPLVVTHGDELKLVYPQAGAPPEQYAALDFTWFYLQPMDGPLLDRNTQAVLEYAERHPLWKVSLQTHKVFGLP